MQLNKYGYILVNSSDIPQGIDESSGGYPYSVPNNIQSIKIWDSLEEIQKYNKMFPKLTIKRIQLRISELSF